MLVKRSGGDVPEYMLKMKKASRQDKRKLAKTAIKREGITKESRLKNFNENKKRKFSSSDRKNSSFKAKKAKLSAKLPKNTSSEWLNNPVKFVKLDWGENVKNWNANIKKFHLKKWLKYLLKSFPKTNG